MSLKRILSVAMVSAVLAVSSSQAQDNAAAFDEKQTQAIEGIVKNYLLKNPELLREVIAELNRRQEVAASEKRKEALASIYKSDSPFATGTGKLTVVEFFDYNCGYCRHAFNEIVKLTDQEKDARVVFIEFPIMSEESRKASEIAIAAARQGKYFAFHQALMAKQGPATEEKALQVAKDLGLNMDQLKKDRESPETASTIERNLALGTAMGVEGTPAFFVGDTASPGAPDDLRKQLSAHLGEVRKNGCSVC